MQFNANLQKAASGVIKITGCHIFYNIKAV